MLPLRSRKNWVRGKGSCSGSQSASRSNVRCSKRLGGLLPAPRAGGDERLTFTASNLQGQWPTRKLAAAAFIGCPCPAMESVSGGGGNVTGGRPSAGAGRRESRGAA